MTIPQIGERPGRRCRFTGGERRQNKEGKEQISNFQHCDPNGCMKMVSTVAWASATVQEIAEGFSIKEMVYWWTIVEDIDRLRIETILLIAELTGDNHIIAVLHRFNL